MCPYFDAVKSSLNCLAEKRDQIIRYLENQQTGKVSEAPFFIWDELVFAVPSL